MVGDEGSDFSKTGGLFVEVIVVVAAAAVVVAVVLVLA
jgi:hypothetical protein